MKTKINQFSVSGLAAAAMLATWTLKRMMKAECGMKNCRRACVLPRAAICFFILPFSFFLLNSARAQISAFTYQGRVTDNGTNFTGAAKFKFVLVTSTNASLANTLVRRDADGNFSAGSLTLAADLNLPAPARIYTGGYLLLYSDAGNTGLGQAALASNTTGDENIASGSDSGYNNTTGSFNIEIGNYGGSGDTHVIRIGTPGTQANTFIAGIYGSTASGGAAVYVNSSGQLGTLTSSRRFKTDIQDMGDASDALLSLRPVTFQYKPEIDPQGTPQFGLIAEEVETVNPSLAVHDTNGLPYTVRYEAVNAMRLNEFLKEHKKVEEQGAGIQDLNARLEKLEQLVNAKNGGRP